MPIWDGHRVLGIVTDRDIASRVVAEGRNPEKTHANEIMTKDVIHTFEDQPILEAVERMRDKRVKRLVVLTPDRQLRGIITLGDIVHQLGEGRLASVVRERVSQLQEERPRQIGRILLGLGATVGILSTILAGTQLIQRQPESERLRTRMGLPRREAA